MPDTHPIAITVFGLRGQHRMLPVESDPVRDSAQQELRHHQGREEVARIVDLESPVEQGRQAPEGVPAEMPGGAGA